MVYSRNAAARAEQIASELREMVPGSPKVVVVELGAVVGAHVGPGTVAIAVSPHVGVPLPATSDEAPGDAQGEAHGEAQGEVTGS